MSLNCYHMFMTALHNAMQLHQNRINFADTSTVIIVCYYISLEIAYLN